MTWPSSESGIWSASATSDTRSRETRERGLLDDLFVVGGDGLEFAQVLDPGCVLRIVRVIQHRQVATDGQDLGQDRSGAGAGGRQFA